MTWSKSNKDIGQLASNIFFPAAVNMGLKLLITAHVHN